MIAFFTGLWSRVSAVIPNLKLIGAGILTLIFFGLLIFAVFERHEAASSRLERDQAKASLASYAATLAAYQASASANIKALEDESARSSDRAASQQKLLGQIQGKTNEQDGPIAPVLRDAIDGLYGTGPATATDKAGRPAKPSYLPTGAAKARP
jgi:hypothetical protein